MKAFNFSIHISYNDFLALYRGSARTVVVTDDYGKTIKLPAQRFLPFVSQLGVRGRFKLSLTDENKFSALERIN